MGPISANKSRAQIGNKFGTDLLFDGSSDMREEERETRIQAY